MSALCQKRTYAVQQFLSLSGWPLDALTHLQRQPFDHFECFRLRFASWRD